MWSPISEITTHCYDRDSNQRCESCKSNVLTTTPPGHLTAIYPAFKRCMMHLCVTVNIELSCHYNNNCYQWWWSSSKYSASNTFSLLPSCKTLIIVIPRSELRDHDWSNARHMMCKNKQCYLVSSVHRHVSGERDIMWFMFSGNMVWTTLHHAIVSIFWSECSITQINTYSMLLHHGWRH